MYSFGGVLELVFEAKVELLCSCMALFMFVILLLLWLTDRFRFYVRSCRRSRMTAKRAEASTPLFSVLPMLAV